MQPKRPVDDEMNAAMLKYMPLRGMVSFGDADMKDVQKLVDQLNAMEQD